MSESKISFIPAVRANRKTNGAVRRYFRAAALVLFAAFGAGVGATPPDGADATVPVPDPGILYVRYGTPGGVKIRSVKRPMTVGSQGDSYPAVDRHRYTKRLWLEELGLIATEWNATGVNDAGARVPSPGAPVAKMTSDPAAVPVSPGASPPLIGLLPATIGPDLAALTAEEAEEELERSGVLRTTRIQFAFDRSDILPESERALGIVGEVLRNNPEWSIRIEGHADMRGTEEYNTGLSMRRADSVRNYLVSIFGIEERRLRSTGFGESIPLVDGTTEEAYAINRRVEFRKSD